MSVNHKTLIPKTRFCPSPTGLLHLGNLRTALFNVLLAKNKQGVFLLRIEDTDKDRSSDYFTECLQEDLLWLNLSWQEGPDKDQGNGPYFQSKRQSIYDEFYHQLEINNLAYPCFCTEEELTLARKLQRMSGKPPRYPGTCRHLTAKEIEEKLALGKKPTLRFRIPDNGTIAFLDLVRGTQQFRCEELGDFIIRRAEGTAPFLFCNAIDDALMGVTHVIRGEDHVTNTPRQILILQALNLPVPHYGHISLIIGNDGSPLSKRHGSKNVAELRAEGYLPNAINNYLARLGHYYGHDQYKTLNELAAEFKIENLSKAPAKFNLQQLNYWQKLTLDTLSYEEFKTWLGEDVEKEVPPLKLKPFIDMIRPNIIFRREAQEWAQILFKPLNVTLNTFAECEVPQHYFTEALLALDLQAVNTKNILNHLKEQLQLKGKTLFQPLRLALTSKAHGPELEKLVPLIEPEEIQHRLQQAKNSCE